MQGAFKEGLDSVAIFGSLTHARCHGLGIFGLLLPVCNPVPLVVILIDCNIFLSTFSRPFLLIVYVYLSLFSPHSLFICPCLLCSYACSWSLCVPALFSLASGLSSVLFFSLVFHWTVLCLPFVVWILDFGHQLSVKAACLYVCIWILPIFQTLKLGTKSQYVLLVHFLSLPFPNITICYSF